MGCSLFKKMPDNNVQGSNLVVKWDDSDYDYDKELNENENLPIAQSTNEIDIEKPIIDNKFYDKYSKILGVEINKDLNKKLVIESSEWIGTKYKFATASKQKHTDCSGFVKNVYKTVYGIDLPHTSAAMAENSGKIKRNNLKEGDLVFFNINKTNVSHVGIYLFDNNFIHASVSRGVIVSNLHENYYKKHYHSSGRVEQ